jgi:hypothetical protein
MRKTARRSTPSRSAASDMSYGLQSRVLPNRRTSATHGGCLRLTLGT